MPTQWNKYESRRLAVVFRETVDQVPVTIEIVAVETKGAARVPRMHIRLGVTGDGLEGAEASKAIASWIARVIPEAWAQWEREYAAG